MTRVRMDDVYWSNVDKHWRFGKFEFLFTFLLWFAKIEENSASIAFTVNYCSSKSCITLWEKEANTWVHKEQGHGIFRERVPKSSQQRVGVLQNGSNAKSHYAEASQALPPPPCLSKWNAVHNFEVSFDPTNEVPECNWLYLILQFLGPQHTSHRPRDHVQME